MLKFMCIMSNFNAMLLEGEGNGVQKSVGDY